MTETSPIVRRSASKAAQSGSSAIEFAFVLPLLIAITYSIFVYSYTYVVFQAINYAAQEAAEAAVAVEFLSDPGEYQAELDQQAGNIAAAVLSWLPASQKAASVGSNGEKVVTTLCQGSGPSSYCPTLAVSGSAVVVEINFPLKNPTLFQAITLPLIGTFPPLPDALKGVGVVMISN